MIVQVFILLLTSACSVSTDNLGLHGMLAAAAATGPSADDDDDDAHAASEKRKTSFIKYFPVLTEAKA